MKKTGWYEFTDGYYAWFSGMSEQERKVLESKHGKILRFFPTT